MKQTEITQAVNDVIAEDMAILDEFYKTEILPLIKSVGTPEDVLKKKYENWQQEDFMKAESIFRNLYSEEGFVPKKEVQELAKLEAEEV